MKRQFSSFSMRQALAGACLTLLFCLSFNSCYRSKANSQAQADSPENVTRVPREESLARRTPISVDVSIDGMREISEQTYKAQIEAKLKEAGIAVRASTDPPSYPNLVLTVNVSGGNMGGVHAITGDMALDYDLLLPIGNGKYTRATTWTSGKYFWLPSIEGMALRGYADELTDHFVKAYRKVNSK